MSGRGRTGGNAVSGAGNPGSVGAIGNSIIYASGTFGLLEALCVMSGGALWPMVNAGKNGDTTRPSADTTGMTARFDAEVGAFRPSIVLAMEAVNNMGKTPVITPAQAAADMSEMAAKTRAWGGRFILIGSPTFASNPVGLDAYNKAYQRAAYLGGFEYINPWQDCINTATGAFIDTTWGYADGVHPTTMAIRYAAARLWAALAPTINAQRCALPFFNADTGNRFSNPLFLNSASGVPTGYSQAGATTASAIRAGSDPVIGNWWDITASGLSGYSVWNMPFSYAGLAPGKVFWVSGRVQTTGLEVNGSGSNPGQGRAEVYINFAWTGASGIKALDSIGMDVSGVFGRYITVPAGAVGVTTQLAFGPRSGSISGVASLAMLNAFDVAA